MIRRNEGDNTNDNVDLVEGNVMNNDEAALKEINDDNNVIESDDHDVGYLAWVEQAGNGLAIVG